MMKLLLHSPEPAIKPPVPYESIVTVSSTVMPGVEFRIVRLSFGRRMELARSVLELSRRAEFLQAGEKCNDGIEAHVIACEIDRLYLEWGLVEVAGLQIDGEHATPESLIETGPEDLAHEIVAAIKRECALTEQERKN
jgi:hypothetical protein